MDTEWPWHRERELKAAYSVASASCTVVSTPSCQSSREEQLRALTKEIIALKFNIAEEMGKQDEIKHDWQKLNTEKSSIQEEIADIDVENDVLRADTERVREALGQAMLRLELLAKERSPEQKVEDDVRREFNSVQAEFKAAKVEMDIVDAAGHSLLTDIENLKRDASRKSSNTAKLEAESDEVSCEISKLREEIAKVQQSIQETKSKSAKYDKELISVRKECEKIANQNKTLESKIAKK
jgi:chromosome segregation ATPase